MVFAAEFACLYQSEQHDGDQAKIQKSIPEALRKASIYSPSRARSSTKLETLMWSFWNRLTKGCHSHYLVQDEKTAEPTNAATVYNR